MNPTNGQATFNQLNGAVCIKPNCVAPVVIRAPAAALPCGKTGPC